MAKFGWHTHDYMGVTDGHDDGLRAMLDALYAKQGSIVLRNTVQHADVSLTTTNPSAPSYIIATRSANFLKRWPNMTWYIGPDLCPVGYTNVQHSGTSQSGGSTSTIKLASGASAVDNAYNGYYITSSLSGYMPRKVTAYNGTTKVATINGTWQGDSLTGVSAGSGVQYWVGDALWKTLAGDDTGFDNYCTQQASKGIPPYGASDALVNAMADFASNLVLTAAGVLQAAGIDPTQAIRVEGPNEPNPSDGSRSTVGSLGTYTWTGYLSKWYARMRSNLGSSYRLCSPVFNGLFTTSKGPAETAAALSALQTMYAVGASNSWMQTYIDEVRLNCYLCGRAYVPLDESLFRRDFCGKLQTLTDYLKGHTYFSGKPVSVAEFGMIMTWMGMYTYSGLSPVFRASDDWNDRAMLQQFNTIGDLVESATIYTSGGVQYNSAFYTPDGSTWYQTPYGRRLRARFGESTATTAPTIANVHADWFQYSTGSTALTGDLVT